MKQIDIVSIETGDILGTVTTKYNNLSTLIDNVERWMRRHHGYKAATTKELEERGIKWSKETFWVKAV